MSIFLKGVLTFFALMICNGLLLGQTEKKDSLVWDGSKYVPFSSIPVDTILFDFDKDLSLQIQPIDSILKYG